MLGVIRYTKTSLILSNSRRSARKLSDKFIGLKLTLLYLSTLHYLINVLGRLLSSEKISSMDALTRWWTLIGFLTKFLPGLSFQRGRILIVQSTLDALIVTDTWFQDFYLLYRAVEKFHPRQFCSSHPFNLNFKYFSFIRDAFVRKTGIG